MRLRRPSGRVGVRGRAFLDALRAARRPRSVRTRGACSGSVFRRGWSEMFASWRSRNSSAPARRAARRPAGAPASGVPRNGGATPHLFAHAGASTSTARSPCSRSEGLLVGIAPPVRDARAEAEPEALALITRPAPGSRPRRGSGGRLSQGGLRAMMRRAGPPARAKLGDELLGGGALIVLLPDPTPWWTGWRRPIPGGESHDDPC